MKTHFFCKAKKYIHCSNTYALQITLISLSRMEIFRYRRYRLVKKFEFHREIQADEIDTENLLLQR